MLILPDSAEIKRRVLNRERVGVHRAISRYVLENAQFEVIEDEAYGMLLRLVSEVLTERIVSETQTVHLDVPASWWDAFKQTYSDSWWLRRFVRRYPVKLTRLSNDVRFERYARYPNADIPKQVTPLGRPIIFEATNKSGWHTP